MKINEDIRDKLESLIDNLRETLESLEAIDEAMDEDDKVFEVGDKVRLKDFFLANATFEIFSQRARGTGDDYVIKLLPTADDIAHYSWLNNNFNTFFDADKNELLKIKTGETS